MVRSTRADPLRDELPEIEVFGIGPGGELVADGDPLPTATDVLRTLTHAVGDGVDHARHVQARSGVRLGPTTDRPDRRGAREDVVAPVLVDPVLSSALVYDGLFEQPLPTLSVDVESLAVDSRGMTWEARVKASVIGRSRAAMLRIHPSPSSNITVIELIPERPRRLFMTGGFVRAGVIAVEALGQRIMSRAAGLTV